MYPVPEEYLVLDDRVRRMRRMIRLNAPLVLLGGEVNRITKELDRIMAARVEAEREFQAALQAALSRELLL